MTQGVVTRQHRVLTIVGIKPILRLVPREPFDLLATVQVCERVGIDRSTLSRYVKEGRIAPAMKLPGRTGAMLFNPADVDTLNDWYHGARLTEQAAS